MKRLIAKPRDRGMDGKPINHMETSNDKQTNFAHRLLHMWWNKKNTDWTEQQIIDEHKKVVDIMKNKYQMNHNMKDSLDDTLSDKLKSSNTKTSSFKKEAVYLHCHNCDWDNGDFMYNDDGTLQDWVPDKNTKRFKKMDKSQIYKTETEFEEKNPERKCPMCGKQELDMD
jgi:Zn finger protein HypA/HybF involved in hydrogenase expression